MPISFLRANSVSHNPHIALNDLQDGKVLGTHLASTKSGILDTNDHLSTHYHTMMRCNMCLNDRFKIKS